MPTPSHTADPGTSRPAGSGGTWSALASTRFRIVFAAAVVSSVGSWMQITARGILVFDLTGSTAALGTVYLFSYLPQLLVGPFAGALADRVDRRALLLAAQLVVVAGSLAVAALVAADVADTANLSAVSFVMGAAHTVQAPAASALLPALVGPAAIGSAVSLTAAVQSGARIAGPLLAGLLIPLAGVEWVFVANAAAGATVVAAWLAVPVTVRIARTHEGPLRSIVEGFRYVRRTPPVGVPMLALLVLSTFGLVYQPLSVPFTREVLAGGDEDLGTRLFGVLQLAIGVGAVVGVLGLGRLGERRPAAALVASGIGFSVSLALLGATSWWPVAVLAGLGIGAFQFANAALVMTIAQRAAPEEFRGRVMSIHFLAFIGTFPLMSQASGWAAGAVGTRTTMLAAAAVCLAFSALVLPRWRGAIRPAQVMDPAPVPTAVTP